MFPVVLMSKLHIHMRGIDLDLDLIGMKARTYRAKVSQICKSCGSEVLALRINGFYAGSRDRIFLWECPSCGDIWRNANPKLKSVPQMSDGQ